MRPLKPDPRGRAAAFLRSAANAADGFVERHPGALLAVFSAVYWIGSLLIARDKVFRADEFLSLYAASLPDLAAIWRLTREGALSEPPLFAAVAHFALQLIPSAHVGLRVSSIFGGWIFALTVFGFSREVVGRLFAFSVMLALLCTPIQSYAIEGRPYGLLLGLLGLALYSWMRATDAQGSRRSIWIWILGLSLVAAGQTHYYGFLLAFPLVLGEAVRTFRKRADRPVRVALGLGLASNVLLLPFAAAARDYVAHSWSTPGLGKFIFFHRDLFVDLIPPVLLAAGMLGLIRLATPASEARPRQESASATGRPLPPHLMAAAVGLCLFGPVAYLVSVVVTNTFALRYILPATVGWVLLGFAWTARITRAPALVGCVALASFVPWYLADLALASVSAKSSMSSVPEPESVRALARTEKEPIVISEKTLFLRATLYWPEDLRARTHYLADREASVRFLGKDSAEIALQRLSRRAPLQVRPYSDFLASHSRFLVLDDGGWLVSQLLEDGAQLALLGRAGGSVYEVSLQAESSRKASDR